MACLLCGFWCVVEDERVGWTCVGKSRICRAWYQDGSSCVERGRSCWQMPCHMLHTYKVWALSNESECGAEGPLCWQSPGKEQFRLGQRGWKCFCRRLILKKDIGQQHDQLNKFCIHFQYRVGEWTQFRLFLHNSITFHLRAHLAHVLSTIANAPNHVVGQSGVERLGDDQASWGRGWQRSGRLGSAVASQTISILQHLTLQRQQDILDR